MKRIISTSLIMIALCAQVLGQGAKQLAAQNLVSATDITSIPLSDTLDEKVKGAEARLEKSSRERRVADNSAAVGEKKRYWVEAEYLNWRTKESNLPPLVQSRVTTVFPATFSQVILGGGEVNPGNAGGGRITAGMWLNQGRTVGVEASYFYLGPRSVNDNAGGNGDCIGANPNIVPFITRPFVSAVPGNVFYVISSSCSVRGNVAYSLANHLQGAESNIVYEPSNRRFRGVRLVGGFRFLDLKERFTIIDNHVHSGAQSLDQGNDSFYLVTDEFATRNRFYGGQGGVERDFSLGKVRLELSGKVALGAVRQLVNISGSTNRAYRTLRETRFGGFLAVESNIGRYERTRLAILPEAKANIGYQFTGNIQAFAGYDFLYISRAARPVEQISLLINWYTVPYLRNVQTPVIFGVQPRQPEFSFSDSPFWARGLTVGLRLGF